jgi:hypothetical protein
MIFLFIYVCALGLCHGERIPVDKMTLQVCNAHAQEIAAAWVNEHPHYTLRGYECSDETPT